MKIQLLNAVMLRGLGPLFEQIWEDKANVSLRIQKFSRPHVSLFKSNLPVRTYPTRNRIHSTTQDSFGNIGNRACVVKRAKFASRIMAESAQNQSKMRRARLTSQRVRVRIWERGCHLEYGIHGKELGSILLRHRIKKYPDLASTRFRTHNVFKNFYSGERIQKVPDSYAGFTGYM